MSPYQLILPSNYAEYFNSDKCKLTLESMNEGVPVMLKAVHEVKGSGVKPIRLLPDKRPTCRSTQCVILPQTLGKLHEQLKAWGSDLLQPLEDTVFESLVGRLKKKAIRGGMHTDFTFGPRIKDGCAQRTDVLGYYVNASRYDLACALDLLGPKKCARFPASHDTSGRESGHGMGIYPADSN